MVYGLMIKSMVKVNIILKAIKLKLSGKMIRWFKIIICKMRIYLKLGLDF